MQISGDFVYAINLKQFSNGSTTLKDTKNKTKQHLSSLSLKATKMNQLRYINKVCIYKTLGKVLEVMVLSV